MMRNCYTVITIQEIIPNPLITKYTALVGPLNFYIQYNLKIQFYNPMGVGPMSPVVNAMSAEDSELINFEMRTICKYFIV